jgi:hypothetical protein
VFATGRPDALVVVYAGRPRPGEWLRALRAIGYRTLARDRAKWSQPEQRTTGSTTVYSRIFRRRS